MINNQGLDQNPGRMNTLQAFKRLPIFSGEKPGEVTEWLIKVKVCNRMLAAEVPENQRVDSMILQMERSALAWAARDATDEQKATVAAFTAAIRRRFVSRADQERAKKRFYGCKQGTNERVVDYYTRMRR